MLHDLKKTDFTLNRVCTPYIIISVKVQEETA